jgi:dienelactone hydrolase
MFGWEATRDVDAGVARLRRRPEIDRARIGGIGLSAGGGMMPEATAHPPPPLEHVTARIAPAPPALRAAREART